MTQILKILDVDDGKWKQDFSVFSFWELSFSSIFVKLSKEWDPPIWLVPSHNVSLQKSVWHSHSNPFFSLSFLLLHFFFLFPRDLSSHWTFITPPQATTTTLVVAIISNHHKPPWDQFKLSPDRAFVLSLSLFPPFARLISLLVIFSLSHPFCQIGSSLCLISWFGPSI